MPLPRYALLDLSSIGLSVLCLVHCLALPVLVAVLPAFSQVLAADWVHMGLVCLAIPLTIWALYQSGGWHRQVVVILAVSGLMLLALAAFVAELHDYEIAMSILGALLVASAHALNTYLHARAHRKSVAHDCHGHHK